MVDGEAFTYSGDESGEINVKATTGHTTWGQKDITATVKYKTEDGQEFSASKTITRQITGLPYVAAPPKNSGENPWKSSGAGTQITWENNHVTLTGWGSEPYITSPSFHVPTDIPVSMSTKVSRDNKLASLSGYNKNLQIWINENSKAYDSQLKKNSTYEGTINSQTMTSTYNTWTVKYTYGGRIPETYVYYFNINYR